MATAGQFGEIPLECTYWTPVEAGVVPPGSVYPPPPEFIGVFMAPPVPILEIPDPLAPYAVDAAASAARLQKLLRLPPSYPWTPGPTLPTDDVPYARGLGYTTPPLPLWIKPGFVYGPAPNLYVPRPALEPIIPGSPMVPFGTPPWHPLPQVQRRAPQLRHGSGNRSGPAPPPPGGRRNRDSPGQRAQSVPSEIAEQPAGPSDYREFSPDVSAEPDSDIADQLLLKKKEAASKAEPTNEAARKAEPKKEAASKAEPTNEAARKAEPTKEADVKADPGTSVARNDTPPGDPSLRQKIIRVYSAATLKSLNIGGRGHGSPTASGVTGKPTLSEPRIEYCWPDETPSKEKQEPPVAPPYRRQARYSAPAKPSLPPRAKSSLQNGSKQGPPRDRGPRRRSSVTAW
ncbi:zyxin-like [Dermacentor albipictus]|uniref:zyxin-like n=1 Tax=Dermacentor albipictus TaxID=60249 RepID=UPI0031FD5627